MLNMRKLLEHPAQDKKECQHAVYIVLLSVYIKMIKFTVQFKDGLSETTEQTDMRFWGITMPWSSKINMEYKIMGINMTAVFSTIYIYMDNIHFHWWVYIYFCSMRNQHWTRFSFPFWIHKSRDLLFVILLWHLDITIKERKPLQTSERQLIAIHSTMRWPPLGYDKAFNRVGALRLCQNIHQSWNFTFVTIYKTFTKVGTSLWWQFTKNSPKLKLHFCHNSQNIH